MELIHGDGDRSGGTRRTRTLAVQIDLELVHELIRHCRGAGLDMSSVVTEAVEAYLGRARSVPAQTA
jgi:hypothetical protein